MFVLLFHANVCGKAGLIIGNKQDREPGAVELAGTLTMPWECHHCFSYQSRAVSGVSVTPALCRAWVGLTAGVHASLVPSVSLCVVA